jgi:hypothetical protein
MQLANYQQYICANESVLLQKLKKLFHSDDILNINCIGSGEKRGGEGEERRGEEGMEGRQSE